MWTHSQSTCYSYSHLKLFLVIILVLRRTSDFHHAISIAILLELPAWADGPLPALVARRAQLSMRHGGAARLLRDEGLEILEDRLAAAPAPATPEPVDLAPELCRGWQRAASWIIDDRCAAQLRESLDPACCALLESQAGPYASRVLTALPTTPEVRLVSAAFRLTWLRRLRLALPLHAARCRCRR